MTTLLADATIPTIISAISTIICLVVGLITWIAKEIFKYMLGRVATLETREQTILTGVVETVENMQASNKTTADFIVGLVEDQRYEARRRQEDRAEDRRRDDERARGTSR